MTSKQHIRTDGNRDEFDTDFLQIAEDLGVHSGDLECAVRGAVQLLRASRENIRPANRKALRGLAEGLTQIIDRVSAASTRQRLLEAVFEEPDDVDDDELAHYTAWCAAQARVDRAIEGAQDLLALVKAGETLRSRSGRRGYEHWAVAVGSLLRYWVEDLGRELTVSGHPDDPRGVNPSPAVRYVHACVRLAGEDITEQACRTIVNALRKDRNTAFGTLPISTRQLGGS